MLTNELLKEIKEESMHAIYPAEVGEMARELLSLRTLPEMAEVDALQSHYNLNYIRGVKLHCVTEIADIARRAIAFAEIQRKRADEAKKIIRELKDNFGEMETGA